MSLLTRAGDLVYTFRFLKLLVTNFEETDAYKKGIIDENGNRVKSKKIETSEEKAAYTTFHRLVFNVKKLMAKAPGGSSKIASYAAALYLIKEHLGITEKNLTKIVKESGLDTLDFLNENNQWFVLENNEISPGIYRVRNSKLLSVGLEEMVNPKDKIRVLENTFPVDSIFGINIYEAKHMNTGKTVHFTLGEIYK